jgi:hypothetical protein
MFNETHKSFTLASVAASSSRDAYLHLGEGATLHNFIVSSSVSAKCSIWLTNFSTNTSILLITCFVRAMETVSCGTTYMVDRETDVKIVVENYDKYSADIYVSFTAMDPRAVYDAKFDELMEDTLRK